MSADLRSTSLGHGEGTYVRIATEVRIRGVAWRLDCEDDMDSLGAAIRITSRLYGASSEAPARGW